MADVDVDNDGFISADEFNGALVALARSVVSNQGASKDFEDIRDYANGPIARFTRELPKYSSNKSDPSQ